MHCIKGSWCWYVLLLGSFFSSLFPFLASFFNSQKLSTLRWGHSARTEALILILEVWEIQPGMLWMPSFFSCVLNMEISSVKLNFVSEIARPRVTLLLLSVGATDYTCEVCTLVLPAWEVWLLVIETVLMLLYPHQILRDAGAWGGCGSWRMQHWV